MLTNEQKIYRDYLMKHFRDCHYDMQRTIIWVSRHFEDMRQYEFNVYQAYRELNTQQKNEVIAEIIMLSRLGSDYDAEKYKSYVSTADSD